MPDRGFVGFGGELDTGAWKAIATKKYEDDGKKNAAALLEAPLPVVWKLQLRWSTEAVVAALGALPLTTLDAAWDAAQRRLFHRIAAGVDDDKRAVRDAADRLRSQLLSGSGTAQNALDYDGEVDFGRQQLALTSPGKPLAADVKKLGLEDALADVARTTEALAKGLGRTTGDRRRTPSKQVRQAVDDCVTAFTTVHDQIEWLAAHSPAGPARDHLTALLKPLENLLDRHQPGAAPAPPTDPAEPASPPQDSTNPA